MEYIDKNQSHTVTDGTDTMRVHKWADEDEATITLTTDTISSVIVIRSREQLEQLHFLLGQLLS
jgi:hypothetical protein